MSEFVKCILNIPTFRFITDLGYGGGGGGFGGSYGGSYGGGGGGQNSGGPDWWADN